MEIMKTVFDKFHFPQMKHHYKKEGGNIELKSDPLYHERKAGKLRTGLIEHHEEVPGLRSKPEIDPNTENEPHIHIHQEPQEGQ